VRASHQSARQETENERFAAPVCEIPGERAERDTREHVGLPVSLRLDARDRAEPPAIAAPADKAKRKRQRQAKRERKPQGGVAGSARRPSLMSVPTAWETRA